ncbi:MAG: hypothetical protein HY063_12425 [Bacteroidetes bacterium]|nr:hypothetical protein [Bacteroidota bacterium]
MRFPFLISSAFFVLIFFSCNNNFKNRNEVVVHLLAAPEMLNPINYSDSKSGQIINHIFQRLMDVDYRQPENFVPVLSESRPQVEKTSDGKMLITYHLRKEARWDNGTPVTAKDVEFTFKTVKCPLVNNQNAKSYFDFISDFKLYAEDPLKFTIISNKIYFLAEAASADAPIIPEYFYDPKRLMRNFTLKQIAEEGEKLKKNEKMKEFAGDFNSEKRMRDPGFISGSGAYKFSQWKTNERIVLEKKENWWGDKLEKENCYFEAYPDKLIYQIIKDQTTAIVSLKAGNLDVMNSIKSKDFVELNNSEKFTENFNAYNPMMYAYSYIAINTKNPLLADKLTRQALVHLVDVDKMIQAIKYGQAQRVIGPVHPSKKKEYNSELVPYDYNIGKTKKLLEESGWKNTNGDETLDKIIDGKHTEFIIDFLYNAESDERKSIALMFQQEAKKIGIQVNIISVEFAIYIQRCKNHEFDLTTGQLLSGPTPDDFKQTFHSESTNNKGANYTNFCNAECDAVIDSIRTELNENKRAIMYKRFQKILYDEVPIIFLWAPTERIAIHKRFSNVYPSVMRPGFWEAGFSLVKTN